MILNPRSLAAKLITLAAFVTFILALYTYTSQTTYTFSFPELSIFSQSRIRGSCSPDAWNNGHWEHAAPPTNLTAISNRKDALQFAGFEGCASDREFFWHLASDKEDQWWRWPAVSSYKWVPSKKCDVRTLDGSAMVKDMVEDGGWLLVGGEYHNSFTLN